GWLHEAGIARQISSPIAKTLRRHQHQRQGVAHSVTDRKLEGCGIGAMKKLRNLRRNALHGEVQRGSECGAERLGLSDCERSDVAVGADIDITRAIPSQVESEAFRCV